MTRHKAFTFLTGGTTAPLVALALAACGGRGATAATPPTIPTTGSSSQATTTAPHPRAAPPANMGIPQKNGGDGDSDNNGGPSDGDGNV